MTPRAPLQRLIRRARYAVWVYRRRRRLRHPPPLEDTDVAVLIDMERDSSTLLLAFGGMDMQMGIPPFEFLALTGEMPVKRLFVRDPRQAWYHRGIPEHGHTLEEVAESLRELIAAHHVERLVVAGNSAGGYAALVFGTLLEAETVLSFAPQTTLDMSTLRTMEDRRWNDFLRPLKLDSPWTDLATALPRARSGATRYRVYFDDSFDVDRRHAERLKGIDGLRLYRFGRGSHSLVRSLRDTGALERIVRAALDAPA